MANLDPVVVGELLSLSLSLSLDIFPALKRHHVIPNFFFPDRLPNHRFDGGDEQRGPEYVDASSVSRIQTSMFTWMERQASRKKREAVVNEALLHADVCSNYCTVLLRSHRDFPRSSRPTLSLSLSHTALPYQDRLCPSLTLLGVKPQGLNSQCDRCASVKSLQAPKVFPPEEAT